MENDFAVQIMLAPFFWMAPTCSALGRTAALWLISFAAGFVFTLAFRYFSPQQTLRSNRDQMFAAFLEALLFRYSLSVRMRALARTMGLSLRQLALLLPALAAVFIIALPMFGALHQLFSGAGLPVGHSALVRVHTSSVQALNQLELEAADGLTIETPKLRLPAEQLALWRIGRVSEESGKLLFRAPGAADLTIQRDLKPLFAQSPQLFSTSRMERLLYGSPGMLPAKASITRISLEGPEFTYSLLKSEVSWTTIFLLSCFLGGIVAMKLFDIVV